jgi:hypothetical protein
VEPWTRRPPRSARLPGSRKSATSAA